MSSGPSHTCDLRSSNANENRSCSGQPVLTVMISEIVVDWLKHAFITKFNHIRPSVYERYTDVLCRDLASGSAVGRRASTGMWTSRRSSRVGWGSCVIQVGKLQTRRYVALKPSSEFYTVARLPKVPETPQYWHMHLTMPF
jgi:hypothetical protein